MALDVFDPPLDDGAPTGFITFQIARMHNALNAQAADLLSKVAGLTLGQWRILALVAGGHADTARGLTVAAGLDPGFVSRTLSSMEKAGLVQTSRAKQDRRRLEVRVSKKGRKIFDETLPHVYKRQQHLLDALDEDERVQARSIFAKLEGAAQFRDWPI